ncbi:hypothetical protein [Arthrobacter sp. SRS-W-1-2016]|jgi:hypothetical protein|uniref:hypothetical protein n=1 Tax=Arthrobacter sp. SRS-W-1-2016 TaxID=1930254 RepID=UPI0015C5710C|nr:hypothetical protein [Arthrobacter sp. SRS-W-1-2016]
MQAGILSAAIPGNSRRPGVAGERALNPGRATAGPQELARCGQSPFHLLNGMIFSVIGI